MCEKIGGVIGWQDGKLSGGNFVDILIDELNI
jgi:hypothetical protein